MNITYVGWLKDRMIEFQEKGDVDMANAFKKVLNYVESLPRYSFEEECEKYGIAMKEWIRRYPQGNTE